MKLFSPIKIGGIEIQNRVVMSAMGLGYVENGYINERIIRFYEERSKGGTGLIILGACNIDEHTYSFVPSVHEDRFIPGLQEFTSRVKKHGAKVGCQLWHAGRYNYSILTGLQPVAPSPVFSVLNKEMPRELSNQEIYRIIKYYGMAGRRVKESGFDLVEVIGSAGYLISQFLSPLTNLREDEFGGSLENRMRFGLEVVREVRRQVGKDFPIMFRFAGNELVPGGTPQEELITFARELEKAGVDALNVTGGWHESKVPQLTMEVPNGVFAYLARTIKQAVSIPVVASNRINDPLQAEEILLRGQADLVTIARGLIADPQWVNKAREGKLGQIRKCIACNQGCMDHVFEVKPVECLVNARAGHETEREILPAKQKKRVLVVGGGPAGMEAARIAALRGHKVELWEKNERLGGQLKLAAVPPGRQDFFNLIDFLKTSVITAGVTVKLNHPADVSLVKEYAPEVIIVATGASPTMPSVFGTDKPHVIQAWALLEQESELGEQVVIIGGGAVGCETALYVANMGTIDDQTVKFLLLYNAEPVERIKKLATQGSKKVTLIEQQDSIGRDIGRSTKWGMLNDLSLYGVNVMTSTKVLAIKDDSVVIERNNRKESVKADTVIMAAGSRPENILYNQIKDMAAEVFIIGDALKPRKAIDAIHEGFYVGNTI